MIPRFKPSIDGAELAASMRVADDAVGTFERAFAAQFDAAGALAFPYGRSALWALLKSLGIEGAEVIVPAYTCVVVPHAIVLSGNTCRFVDISLGDYNMNLDDVAGAINERTRAIVATHLFGYPLDCDRLRGIVAAAESKFGRKIYVIHDCAHSFGARWKGRLVCTEGDAALFGLNISKLMTSVFGGMVTSNDEPLMRALRGFRDRTFAASSAKTAVRQRIYLAAAHVAFSRPAYGLVRWLETETPWLDRLTKAYHLDGVIRFPPDHLTLMSDVAASVGLAQLKKYPRIIDAHIANAKFYDSRLRGSVAWELPPIVDGATYSHYVIRVPDRARVVRALLDDGIEAGELIQYSVPHMPAYGAASRDRFPNSLACSEQTINLPVYAGLTEAERTWIATRVAALAARTTVEEWAKAV